MKGLTAKQKNIVDFIEDFSATMEMAPTIYEIAEHFKIKTSTVFAHIRALQKKGILQRSSKARSISLAKSKRKNKIPAGAHTIPVVDSVSSQKALPKREVICDSKMFRKTLGDKNVFAVEVKGADLGHGIFHGDLILVKTRPQNIAPGDLLLMMENGKPVIHSCESCDNGVFELKSSGPDKKNTHFSVADAPIKGIVIGVQRSL